MNRSLSIFSASGLLFFLSFLVILFERAGFSGQLETMIWRLLGPGQAVGNEWRLATAQLDAQRRFILKGGKLLGQLEFTLQEERLTQDSVEMLRKENALLREELGRTMTADEKTFALSGWRDQWFLDGGCLDGLKKDAPVLYKESLVGQVTEVRETSSVIATLFDASWRVPVSIGTGSAKALMDTSRGVPEITEISGQIEGGDAVVTAGIGGLPRGIPIGRVGEVKNTFGKGVMESALLEPYFLPDKLEFVQTLVEKGSTCEVI